ncbi:glutathione S-transferase family protein [Sphingomonas sp. Root710]|uniref:glutathione S-transferase family protein n=1 Tax=Sphingomonas sp. Root710 TaxID=1736594 RepID=UPI0006F22F27|nr:glutathione S-transferase family protein [Sphingomonas sp. Root710]
MLTLFHFGGAICAQKVRLALAEKGVEWESRECAGEALRDPDYLRLNPSGVVPTLVHDRTVLTESRIISEYIEEAFDGPALMPSDPADRHRARLWSKQIDDGLHLNVFILTFAAVGRDIYLAMPADVRGAMLPGLRDPIKRQISSDLLEQGFASPWMGMAVKRFRRLADDMEAGLAGSAALAGKHYSLADADYTAYINRLTNLGMAALWADKPRLADWYAHMQDRPSFKSAILDWQSPEELASYGRSRDRVGEALDAIMVE